MFFDVLISNRLLLWSWSLMVENALFNWWRHEWRHRNDVGDRTTFLWLLLLDRLVIVTGLCGVCLEGTGNQMYVIYFHCHVELTFRRSVWGVQYRGYRIYSIKRHGVKFLSFLMRCLFKGSIYFKIIFLKSLTTITVNQLKILCKTETCLQFQGLAFFLR